MDKKNDMFAVLFYQPESTIDDLALNGITPDNTGIEDKDYYKNLKSVQESDQFKTEGKFDETKFNNFYDSVTRVYNSYAESDWQKQLLSSFARDPYDWTDPFNSNVKDFNVTVDNSNRGRVSFGITGVNKTGNPTLSTREIAQASKMHDKDGNELDFSPNSRGFFKSIFSPTAALAQYDETGLYEENGEQVLHYKGEYKLNAKGDPYYEELGDKDPYGREILRVSDVVSVDGTTLNKYFDVFDSDGIDESVGKTIVKTTAKVAPLLIPGAGQIYGMVGMVAGLAESLPGLINSVNSVFGVQDTEYGKAISTADAYMSRFKETTSDYSKGKFWTFENFGNIITSSASQLFSQRTVAQLSQTLLKGGDALQARKIGQKLSLGYMALTSSTDAFGDFKQAGASDRVAGIGALATMAGLYGLMSQDYFKDWLFKGQWLDENEGKDVVANWMKSKSEYYTKELLGEAVEQGENLSKKEAAGLFTKIKNGTQNLWEKFAKTPVSGKAPHLAENADEVIKTSAGKKALSVFNIMLNRSVNEGVEETMEEVTQDMIKGVFAAGEALGLDLHDKKEDELNFGWSLGDALLRYITSFAGGFFGGAVFEGITQLEYARDHKIQLNDLSDVDSQMMYMLLQGRKNDLLDYAKMYHEKNSFLSKDLSMKVVQRTSDGKLVYAPANGGKNQNDAMYDFICGEINRMDDLLHRNGFTQMALTKYMMEFDKNLDKEQDMELNLINAIKKLKVHTSFMDDMIKVGKDLITVDDGLRNLDRVISDPEKRKLRDEQGGLPTDQAKASLESRKKELEKQRDELFDHKNDYKYIRQALFMLNIPLQKMLLGCLRDGDAGYKAFDEDTYILSGNQGFENYLYLTRGKTSKMISSEERAMFQKEYDAFKAEDKEHISVDLARKLFDLSCAINKAFAAPLTNAESYLKDTTENKEFQRSIILAGTQIFQNYLMAKASLTLYDKKIAELQSEINKATSELGSLDVTDNNNAAQIAELKTLLFEKNNQISSLEEGKANAIEDIKDFEAIYGDDERNMPFLGISFKKDADGKIIEDDIAKEQRAFGRRLRFFDPNSFKEWTSLYDRAIKDIQELTTNSETGEPKEDKDIDTDALNRIESETEGRATAEFGEYSRNVQELVKFVKNYYKGLKDRNELNASDLYLSALTRNILNLINSDAFQEFSKISDDDFAIILEHISVGGGAVAIRKKDSFTDYSPGGKIATLYKDIAYALKASDYGKLVTLKSELISDLMSSNDSLTEEDANEIINSYFIQTIGVNLFDLFEEINQIKKSVNTYDAVNVIKNLGIADDIEVISLFERLKTERNAILQKGTSLQEYIMDPRSKETLSRAQSLLMLAMAAVQAAADGSNATGNSMIHSDDVDKYGVISERTANALLEDIEYYNQCISYLLALNEANERAKAGYYQKCEVAIHRNIITQLIKDPDKESSWAHQLSTVFGINVPELWNSTVAEVNKNVSIETLNKGNFDDFKEVYVKFFSKLREAILKADGITDEKITIDELKGKTADYKIGALIASLLANKNPKLGNYGVIDQDTALTDLTFGTYLTALLNEDYEQFYKSFATIVKAQNKYAPFAAQEVAILTSYEFATSDSNESVIGGFLDAISNTKLKLEGLNLSKNSEDVWNSRKTLKHFILTQGGTGSGKTSACAYFTHALLKSKYGDNMSVIVAAPDTIQAKKFQDILGEKEGTSYTFYDLLKLFYKGDADINGLLNADITTDASKAFFKTAKDNVNFFLKDEIGIKDLEDLKDLGLKSDKFIFIDEATFLNQGAIEFLERVAKKLGFKILTYGDPEQNGAFKRNSKGTLTESGISDFFYLSTPSLGDSVRFENSAKDDNYRVLKTQLSQIRDKFINNAACLDSELRKFSKESFDNIPLNLQIKYYEDQENFVGEKFIKESEVKAYIEKFKKLSKELHKDDPDESKRVPNICIITDDPSQYTAEPGVSVLNPRSVQGLEYDYVIVANHTFDEDFYTKLRDLYTLVGRSKKGSVVVGHASNFKIDNIAGSNVLLTPRNSTGELADFKDWKNKVLDKFVSGQPDGSNQSQSNQSQQNGNGSSNVDQNKAESDEAALEDEMEDDTKSTDHSSVESLNLGEPKEAYKTASDANQAKLNNVPEDCKYSWATFVNWANDTKSGLLSSEGYTGTRFSSSQSIFYDMDLDSGSEGLISNIIQFYRKFASAIVYNAKLNDNQKNAISSLISDDTYKNLILDVLSNWNNEEQHRFVARCDENSNKTLISYATTINTVGSSRTVLIPVAIIDGRKSGTITTSENIFEQKDNMDLIFDPEQKKYPIFGSGLNTIGVVSKPKICTLSKNTKAKDSVKGFIESVSGGMISLVSDAEFLTESDFETIFSIEKEGENVSKALKHNDDGIHEIDLGAGKKKRYVYDYSLNGTVIPFMTMAVRNYVTLHDLYDIANIGLYASGSLKENRLTEQQRTIIERMTGSAGVDRAKAAQYLKQFFGENFDVSKQSNTNADRNSELKANFRALASKFKLLGRADSYYFLGSLYAAIYGLQDEGSGLNTADAVSVKNQFNDNLIHYLAKPKVKSSKTQAANNSHPKYAYRNTITFKIDLPRKDDSKKTYSKYYTVSINRDENASKYEAVVEEVRYTKNGFVKVTEDDGKKHKVIVTNDALTGSDNTFGSGLDTIINAAVGLATESKTSYSAEEISERLKKGNLQMFLTSMSHKIDKDDGSWGPAQINLLNDYQLVSKTLNSIPKTTSAFDAIVKKLYEGGHFKDGICLNANRIITQQGEEERASRGWVDVPYLPNLTKTNFQGVSSRTYVLNSSLTWSEGVPNAYGEFSFNKSKQSTSTNFKITKRDEFNRNVYKGEFKVTDAWWKKYIGADKTMPDGAIIVEINLNDKKIVVAIGQGQHEYSLQGDIRSISDLSEKTIESSTEDALSMMQTTDGKCIAVKESDSNGITKINVNGVDGIVIGKFGEELLWKDPTNKVYTLSFAQDQIQHFGGKTFTNILFTETGETIWVASDQNYAIDKTGKEGFVDSNNIIKFGDGEITSKKVFTESEYSSLKDKHPNVYNTNGTYAVYGDNTISGLALNSIIKSAPNPIDSEDEYKIINIVGSQVTYVDSEGNSYTADITDEFEKNTLSNWTKSLNELKLNRIHQLCQNVLGEDRITALSVGEAAEEFNKLLATANTGKYCNVGETDIEILETKESSDSSINQESSAFENAGYTISKDTNNNSISKVYTRADDTEITVYEAVKDEAIHYIIYDDVKAEVTSIPNPETVKKDVANIEGKLNNIPLSKESEADGLRTDLIKELKETLAANPLGYTVAKLGELSDKIAKIKTAVPNISNNIIDQLKEIRSMLKPDGILYNKYKMYDNIRTPGKCDFK